jgi:AcrR family transcriptional regulator
MSPKPLHHRDSILDAVRTLVLERGVQNATVSAISAESGAPVGSLYHHFGSRDDLVAELWVRAVQRSQEQFLAALEQADAEEAAVQAALSLYDFSQRHREDARLLVSFRREDLLHDTRSKRMARTLKDLNQPIGEALASLARRLFGRSTAASIEQTTFAVVDLPFAAIRRHLAAGSSLPAGLRTQLEAAVRAVLRVRKP